MKLYNTVVFICLPAPSTWDIFGRRAKRAHWDSNGEEWNGSPDGCNGNQDWWFTGYIVCLFIRVK